MPKEYTECVKSYMDKGVSERSAKARCAAAFYKRHGITVNEWVKQHGEVDAIEYDQEMCDVLIQATAPRTCNKHEPLYANVKPMDITYLDDGLIEIVSARVGSMAYTSTGIALTWTEQALQGADKTWNGGPTSINHNDEHVHGKIKYSWYEQSDGGLHQILELDKFLKGWVDRNVTEIGVSIEAFLEEFDDKHNILKAQGKGVTIVLPPHKPACSQEEGCKVLGTDNEPSLPPNSIEESREEKALDNSEVIIMAKEEEKKTSEITAEMYDGVLSEKKKLEEEFEAMKAKMIELEAFKKDTIEAEKATLLATIKNFGLDPSIYEKNDNAALKLIVATAESVKKSLEDEPVIDSGAKITATKTEAPKSAEEIEADEVWAYVRGDKK